MRYLKKFEAKMENPLEGKEIIFIDMDDTICDYTTHYNKMSQLNPDVKYPQSKEGFFLSLKPLEGAIESVNKLREIYDVYILTSPSYKNPLCYTEKRIWIEKHFDLDFCRKLIISPNKNILMGDYLIDDILWDKFKGEQIQFGKSPFENWNKVIKHLIK